MAAGRRTSPIRRPSSRARKTARRRSGSWPSCAARKPPGCLPATSSLPWARTDVDVWQITWFTLATAALATLLMLPPGLLIAWALARKTFRGRLLVDTIVSLPLVMPPVATGLLLLTLFAPFGPIGRVLERAGVQVVFTWKAVVLAMTV